VAEQGVEPEQVGAGRDPRHVEAASTSGNWRLSAPWGRLCDATGGDALMELPASVAAAGFTTADDMAAQESRDNRRTPWIRGPPSTYPRGYATEASG
jgi:hypothetical protein